MKEYKAIRMSRDEIVGIIESKGHKVYEIYDDFMGAIELEDECDVNDILSEHFNSKSAMVLYFCYGINEVRGEFIVLLFDD